MGWATRQPRVRSFSAARAGAGTDGNADFSDGGAADGVIVGPDDAPPILGVTALESAPYSELGIKGIIPTPGLSRLGARVPFAERLS